MAITNTHAFLLELFGELWSSPTSILIFISAALIGYILLEYYQRPPNYPPGPWRIPLIGSTVMTSAFPPAALVKLARKYGDVMSIPVGAQTWVVLGSAEVTQEAFGKISNATSGRPESTIFSDIFTENGHGITYTDTDLTRMHKRFLMMTFRNLGLGRNIFEERINEQIKSLLVDLCDNQRKAVDPKDKLLMRLFNFTASVSFGRHFKPEDAEVYVQKTLGLIDLLSGGSLGKLFPFLRFFPGDLCKHNALREYMKYFTWYIGKQIQLHKDDDLTPEDEPDDYIGAFLQRANELGETAEQKAFTDTQLTHLIVEFNSAGIDTTANTILHALVFLLHFPQIQERIVDELNDVFPANTTLTSGLRNQCTYTEAFILEVLRIAPVLPIGLPHRTTEPITIGSYHLPKNTLLVSNFWGINHDERVWQNADDFDPGHFLDDAGRIDPKPKKSITFSVGRRACPGEKLARLQVFLFLANILKHFHVGLPPGDALPQTRGKFDTVNGPTPFKIIFTPRNSTD